MCADSKYQVTITLTRLHEPDELVTRVITSACMQREIVGEVLFIEQNLDGNISEANFAGSYLPVRIVRKALAGLSQARNLALDQAKYPVVLFLDADAIADPDWAAELARVLNRRYAIAGSCIRPGWPGRPPYFGTANIVQDQYSLLELGEGTFPYHRVVGAAFGIDTAKLPRGMRFDEGLGRRDGRLFGGEESDFCRRAKEAGADIAYVGCSSVLHVIPQSRVRITWLLRRMFYAGHGRAMLGGSPAPSRSPRLADWLCLPIILPPYALGWLWGKLSG